VAGINLTDPCNLRGSGEQTSSTCISSTSSAHRIELGPIVRLDASRCTALLPRSVIAHLPERPPYNDTFKAQWLNGSASPRRLAQA